MMTEATTATEPALDWSKLAFDIVETSSHVVYTWRGGVWDAGVAVQGSATATIPLSVFATALHYGQSCFEGLKAFRMRDGKVRVFRPELNARRMIQSCEALAMAAPPVDLFVAAVLRAVRDNLAFVPPYGSAGSLYIRPLVMGSGPQIGLSPADEFKFVVLVNPHGFDRAAPRGTGHIKLGGNYAPALGPTLKAKKQGYTVMLFLDPKTGQYVEEFATSNFAALSKPDDAGRRVYVTPKSRSILQSVTNRSLAEIAAKVYGWTVERRPVPWTEVLAGAFDEVVACGTAVVVTPIGSIDREISTATTTATASSVVSNASNAAVSTASVPIDDLWKDADDADDAALQIENVKIESDFVGFKALRKTYRDIQTGDFEGWEALGWMQPAEGIC
ncbi:aminotransferase [Entophlyctis helioformis]|nr:aminotransferase [Entophlyctis helioformis]